MSIRIYDVIPENRASFRKGSNLLYEGDLHGAMEKVKSPDFPMIYLIEQDIDPLPDGTPQMITTVKYETSFS